VARHQRISDHKSFFGTVVVVVDEGTDDSSVSMLSFIFSSSVWPLVALEREDETLLVSLLLLPRKRDTTAEPTSFLVAADTSSTPPTIAGIHQPR
jgi:hypothetical protein